MTETNSGHLMENSPTKNPIDVEGGSPGQPSRTHAATAIQSSVKPDDYPEAERAQQGELSNAGANKPHVPRKAKGRA